MPPRIKIESLTSSSPVEIVQLDGGLTTFGREPENHIVVDSVAVSRRHASIFSAEDHWLLKDFESSNGTWVNGAKVSPGAITLLRHGDIVKFADFSIRISEIEPREESFWRGFPPSLLVFYKEQFDSEYPLATVGSGFQLGGAEGHYFIEGADPEYVFFNIARSTESMELQVPNVQEKVSVNATLVSGIVSLSDRDELVVPPYRIVVNYPAQARTSAGMGTEHEGPDIRASLQSGMQIGGDEDGWVSEAARRKASLGQKFLFGDDGVEGMDRTQAVPQVHPEEFAPIGKSFGSQSGSGYEMSASQKFSAAYMNDEAQGKGVGDNLLVIFGAVIFILLIVFLIYVLATLG